MIEQDEISAGFDTGYQAIRAMVGHLKPYSDEPHGMEELHAGLMLSILVSATEELGPDTALSMIDKVKNSFFKSVPNIKRSIQQ